MKKKRKNLLSQSLQLKNAAFIVVFRGEDSDLSERSMFVAFPSEGLPRHFLKNKQFEILIVKFSAK